MPTFNVTPGNLFGGIEGSSHRNTTLFVLIPGGSLTPVSSFKLIFNVAPQTFFPGHNVAIGQMAILRTDISKNVVLDSTPVLIGGISNPTIAVPGGSNQNNPQIITTDTINLALDNDHDYYFACFFADVDDNGFWDMSNCPASPLPSFFNGTGNKVANATIPIVSSWGTGAAGRFLSRVVADTGRIVVHKTTVPAGSSQSFTFNPSWEGSFSLTDGQAHDSGALLPGTYSITEDPVSQWGTFISVSNGNPATAIVVGPGDVITVTFTNSLAIPTPPATDCIPTPLAPAGPQTWVYDFGTKGWFQLSRGFTSLAVFEIGDGELVLVGGSNDGFVYVIDDLNGSFDLSGICPAASFRPALIDFGDPASMRVFKYLELEFTCDDLARDITVTFWLDPKNVDNPGTGRKMIATKVRGSNRWRYWPQGGALCQRLLLDITVKASTNVGAIRGAKIVADKVTGLTT